MSDVDHEHIYRNGIDNYGEYNICECGHMVREDEPVMSDIDRIDEKLDELLSELRSGTINFDADAKQAIKQFIASELSKRLNAHYADGLGTYDYDGIAESMIEWMGELKGEGK